MFAFGLQFQNSLPLSFGKCFVFCEIRFCEMLCSDLQGQHKNSNPVCKKLIVIVSE